MAGELGPARRSEAEVSEAGSQRRASEPRVSLGIPELDEMLSGGLMPHRPYLLVGPAGTGKTTLALEFLCEGVRHGERGLYVTIEDPPNEVRWNHRALRPALDAVDVFDAIPDVMRYERAPFKDISATREVVPFARVPEAIRQTPELTSVEVTGTALEQLLRSEMQRRSYARLVIDSLTALQYFCMKGFDPTVGAQTFLRFLTDLRATTLLTVESPLEDVETPERMLARGEIRLFRWELEGVTVRAIGVEKLRGSSHDARLHPYRIGSKGIVVQLDQTISRDTRQIVEPAMPVPLTEELALAPPAVPAPVAAVVLSEPLAEQIRDLVTLGVDVAPMRSEVEATLAAVRASRTEEVAARLSRLSAMAISLAPLRPPSPAAGPTVVQAFQRVAGRADRIREGRAPTQLPPPDVLARDLGEILTLVPPSMPAPPAAPAVPSPVRAPTPEPARPLAVPSAPPAVPVSQPGVRPAPPAAPAAVARLGPARPELPTQRAAATPQAPSPGPPVPSARPGLHRAARRSMVAAPPEPPPLPTVLRVPTGRTPSGRTEAVVPRLPATATPRAAAAPRRRRKAPAPKALAPTPPSTAEAAVAGAAPTTPAPLEPKPRRRVTRRKKAPPVVSATAVPAPETPADPAASPPPPTPGGTTPPETP